MPRTVATVERERKDLIEEKLKLDTEIQDIRDQIHAARQAFALRNERAPNAWWRRVNDALTHKGTRSQDIQVRLRELKAELLNLKKEAMRARPLTLQARTAVLFRVAHRARNFLFKAEGISDDEAEEGLERALDDLDDVCPGWHHRPFQKAS